eukprot:scaffold272706_cov37-Prasinocladus_malaysianus.AAC.1
MSCEWFVGRCRAVLPTSGGPVITGGSDKCLRLWDAKVPEQSYVIVGPQEKPQAYGAPNNVKPRVTRSHHHGVLSDLILPVMSTLIVGNGTVMVKAANVSHCVNHIVGPLIVKWVLLA